jgi:hypothetical protein
VNLFHDVMRCNVSALNLNAYFGSVSPTYKRPHAYKLSRCNFGPTAHSLSQSSVVSFEQILFFSCQRFTSDRLCGLVVRVPGC